MNWVYIKNTIVAFYDNYFNLEKQVKELQDAVVEWEYDVNCYLGHALYHDTTVNSNRWRI